MTIDDSELRAESDATMAALDTIRELEQRKRRLMPVGEEFLATARQIREISEVLMRTVTRQEELAEAVADPTVDVQPDVPIDEMEPQDSLPAILAEWRSAERRLAEAKPGTEQERDLQDAIERLRRAYSEAHARHTKGRTGVGTDPGSQDQ